MLPFRCDLLMCCRCVLPASEFAALARPGATHPRLLSCFPCQLHTLVLCVAAQTFGVSQTVIGVGQAEPGLLLPPPSDNFGFKAHEAVTKGKANRAESLNIGQRYIITVRRCTD